MFVEYGAWTVAVVAVVGAITLLVGWKRPFVMLSALILGVPFRDFATRWMNVHTDLTISQVTAIGRWWFVVIVALLAMVGARWLRSLWNDRRRPAIAAVDILFAVVLVVGLWATFASPNRLAAVTSFRGYFQPIGVYFLARVIRPSRRELRILLQLWLVVGLIMAVFAISQATTWTEATYRAEGYIRQNGDLLVPGALIRGQEYLRPASTVSGPFELGVEMMILFSLALLRIPKASGAARLALAGLALIFAAGLSVTVTRSAFLAFAVALGALLALQWGELRRWLGSISARGRAGFLLASVVGMGVVTLILSITGMLDRIAATMSTLTTQWHIIDVVEAVEYLFDQPQGVGMGLVEPKGALLLLTSESTFHVESSILQIAMEMGVWGLAAWLVFWSFALVKVFGNWGSIKEANLKALTGTAFVAWIGSLAALAFMPLMQSIGLMVWLWFLLGLGLASKDIEAGWMPRAVSKMAVQTPK